MRPDDLPVMAALRQSLAFHSDRQNVIAENVANANTPGYIARDMDVNAFQRAVEAQLEGGRGGGAPAGGNGAKMLTTHPDHIQARGASASRSYGTVEHDSRETTINGNSVVLEEEMIKANESRMAYETSLSLYQKNLNMIRTAIRAPGR